MQNTTYQKTINKSEFDTSSLDRGDSHLLLNNNCRDTSSAHMHKVRYQERTTRLVKVATQDKADTFPKDHTPHISSKVTVAFAVEEWFQICLTYLNYERSKTNKVLMPLPRAILSD